jgi:hypothetical protein
MLRILTFPLAVVLARSAITNMFVRGARREQSGRSGVS